MMFIERHIYILYIYIHIHIYIHIYLFLNNIKKFTVHFFFRNLTNLYRK